MYSEIMSFLKRIPAWQYVAICVIVIAFLQAITYALLVHSGQQVKYGSIIAEFINGQPVFFIVFLFVFLAPLFETLFVQSVPIDYFQNSGIKFSNVLSMVVSTIIFSLLHFMNSTWYPVMVLPGGMLLAFTYIMFQKRDESAFWITAVIHSIYNLGMLLIVIKIY